MSRREKLYDDLIAKELIDQKYLGEKSEFLNNTNSTEKLKNLRVYLIESGLSESQVGDDFVEYFGEDLKQEQSKHLPGADTTATNPVKAVKAVKTAAQPVKQIPNYGPLPTLSRPAEKTANVISESTVPQQQMSNPDSMRTGKMLVKPLHKKEITKPLTQYSVDRLKRVGIEGITNDFDTYAEQKRHEFIDSDAVRQAASQATSQDELDKILEQKFNEEVKPTLEDAYSIDQAGKMPDFVGNTNMLTEKINSELAKPEYEKEIIAGAARPGLAGGINYTSQFKDGKNSYAGRMLESARIFTEDAQTLINADKGNDKSFIKNVGTGIVDVAKDIDTWMMSKDDLSSNADLLVTLNKQEKGEELSDEEQILLDAAANKTLAEMYTKLPAGYKAGKMFAEQIPFMLQLAAGSGIINGAGSGVKGSIFRYVAKKFTNKAAKTGAKAILGLTKALAVSGATLPFQTTTIAEGAQERQIGAVLPGQDMRFSERKKTDSSTGPLSAMAKETLSMAIENFTEQTGAFFEPGMNKLGARVLDTKFGHKYQQALKAMSFPEIKKMYEAGFWNGLPSEWLEEQEATILHAMTGDAKLSDLIDKEQQADILVGLATTQGIFAMANTTASATQKAAAAIVKKRYKDEYLKAREKAVSLFSEDIMQQLDKSNFEDGLFTVNSDNPAYTEVANNYVAKKLRFDAMIQAASKKADAAAEEAKEDIMKDANQDTGIITQAKINDEPVFVVSGDASQKDGLITVRHKDGTFEQLSSEAVSDIVMFDPAQAADEAAAAAKDQVLQSESDDITFSPDNVVEPGVTVNIDGTTMTVIDSDGENVMLGSDSGEITLPYDQVRQFIQDDLDAANTTKDEQAEPELVPVDNNPKPVAPEGGEALPLQMDDNSIQAPEIVQNNPEENPKNEEISGRSADNDTVANSEIVLNNTRNHPEDEKAMPFPTDQDGNIDYSQIEDTDRYADALMTEFPDNSIEVINELIQDNEKAIKDAVKKDEQEASKQKSAIERARAKAAMPNQKAAKAEQERLSKIKNSLMLKIHRQQEAKRKEEEEKKAVLLAKQQEIDAQKAAKDAEHGIVDATSAPVDVINPDNAPDFSTDKASDARGRGYRMQSGYRINRQEPIQAHKGRQTQAAFSTNDSVDVDFAIINSDDAQPSHISKQRNPKYFISEAQPKERTDNVSDIESDKIARNINPELITASAEAYSGAPITNNRGEVIQGNNRTTALRKMYESYPEQAQAYKQYLIDNAEQFGLDAEQIAAMDKPMLVRIADIEDNEAIRLGQKTASDLESGGKQRIDSKTTLEKLGDKSKNFTTILFAGDPDVSLTDIVKSNARNAIKYLLAQNAINQTQLQSAFKADGTLTNEAVEDLVNITASILFKGGNDRLETMFASLPDRAKRAILQTIYRDNGFIIDDIREAIEVYYLLSQQKDFAEGTKIEDATRAANSWYYGSQLDFNSGDTFLPVNNYDIFALKLAILFRAESLTQLRNLFNTFYDKVKGEGQNLFDEKEQLPVNEAIKNVFNVEKNGKKRKSDNEIGFTPGNRAGNGEQQQPGSDGINSSLGQSKQGDEQADNSRNDSAGKDEVSAEPGKVRRLNINGSIQGLEGYSVDEILDIVEQEINDCISDNDLVVTPKAFAIIGSRPRGTSNDESDLDVVFEYEGNIKEDVMFNAIHAVSIIIDGIEVDVNPIRAEETGTIDDYLLKSKRYDNEVLAKIKQAESQVDVNPTEAQKKAGNYQNGHVTIQGFDISIEQPAGSTRTGADQNGKAWSTEMKNSYGYFTNSTGKDGEYVDVFLGSNPDSKTVFVIDQVNDKGEFDESKVMFGFNNEQEAYDAYMSNYEKGWQGFSAITPVYIDEFKKWLYDGARQRKPFGEYKDTPKPVDIKSQESQEDESEDEEQDAFGWEIDNDDVILRNFESTRNVNPVKFGHTIRSLKDREQGLPWEETKILEGKATSISNFRIGDVVINCYTGVAYIVDGIRKQPAQTILKNLTTGEEYIEANNNSNFVYQRLYNYLYDITDTQIEEHDKLFKFKHNEVVNVKDSISSGHGSKAIVLTQVNSEKSEDNYCIVFYDGATFWTNERALSKIDNNNDNKPSQPTKPIKPAKQNKGNNDKVSKAQQEADEALNDFLDAFNDLNSNNLGIIDNTAEKQAKMLVAGTKMVEAFTKLGVYKFAEILRHIQQKGIEITEELLNAIKKAYGAFMAINDNDLMNDIKTVRAFTLNDLNIEQPKQDVKREQQKKPEPTEEKKTLKDFPLSNKYITDWQKPVVRSSWDEHESVISDLEESLKAIPGERQNNGIKDIVYAHYFMGATDIFVLSTEGGDVYTYTILNGDTQMSEFGWQNIAEITGIKGMELDFYWTTKPLDEVLYDNDPDYFDNPYENNSNNKQDESEQQDGRSTEIIEAEAETIEAASKVIANKAENVGSDKQQAGEVIEQASGLIEKTEKLLIEIESKLANLKLTDESYSTEGVIHEIPINILAKGAIKKDIEQYVKAIAKMTGLKFDTNGKGKQEIVDINIAPAGGEASFILWSKNADYGVRVSIPFDVKEDEERNDIYFVPTKKFGNSETIFWSIVLKSNKWGGSGNMFMNADVTAKEMAETILKGLNRHLASLGLPIEKPKATDITETEQKQKPLPEKKSKKDIASNNNMLSLFDVSNDNDNDVSKVNKDNNGPKRRTQTKGAGLGKGKQQEVGGLQQGGMAGSNPTDNEPDRNGSGGIPDATPGKPVITEKKQPKRNTRNNRNEKGVDYAPKSVEARFKANVEAIKIAKRLTDEGKQANKQEVEALRKYSGWGGLGTYFNNNNAENAIIRQLLSDEEYEAAESNINSAYYTPTAINDTLWDIATKLGFKGGTILESSAGIGSIIGCMPANISDRSQIKAVEIEPISGAILKLLYPDADVQIKGFQDTYVENGSIDLAITNVPFVTGLSVFDKIDNDLSGKFKNIHDFFIAKNIRKLSEGGIGIFITSSGTLDNSDKLKTWLANDSHADVIGAFRLNNKTFSGTSVTSDIIIVKKRIAGHKAENAIDISEVVAVRESEYKTGETRWNRQERAWEDIMQKTVLRYNKYFVQHPENMGGEMFIGHEKGETYRQSSTGLYPNDKDQMDSLKAWVKRLKQEKMVEKQLKDDNQDITTTKEGSLIIDSKGNICTSKRGKAVPLGINNNKIKGYPKERVLFDYNSVKAALNDVLNYQVSNESDEGLPGLLKVLNSAYSNFIKKYGYFSKNTSITFLKNDVDFPSVQALENYKEVKNMDGTTTLTVSKSNVFDKRVIGFKTEPNPKTVRDAVIASKYLFGSVSLPYISEKLNMETSDIKKQIVEQNIGFIDPASGLIEVRHDYLSGNVREKLKIAKASNQNKEYNKNIEALSKVIPLDIPAHLIEYRLGPNWIDTSLYKRYIEEKYNLKGTEMYYSEGVWRIKFSEFGIKNEKNKEQGVYSKMFERTILGSTLFEAAINNKSVDVTKVVKLPGGETKTIRDVDSVASCALKIDDIKTDFEEWMKGLVSQDAELAESIATKYNELHNAEVPITIDDEFIPESFEGASTAIKLYRHQKVAVIKATMAPCLFAHEVGSGKTFTLISTAMEMRRLGMAQKPMIVVQNSTVGQFVTEAKKLYPNSKILTLSDRDKTPEGRRDFYAKIKYNDWDMVIIAQSVFNMIPDSPEAEQRFIKEKIEEKLHTLEAMRELNISENQIAEAEKQLDDLYDELSGNSNKKKKKGRSAKDTAKIKDNTGAKAGEQLNRSKDDVSYFEEMGVDALLVDEAHAYKRLGFTTTVGRDVKGIDTSGSKTSAGLYIKTRTIFDKMGYRNVVFATGTPISNTAAEIWTFMKYLMKREFMEENQIYYFDDFVHNFGSISKSPEHSTSGVYKENTRFRAYFNSPELIRKWAVVTDTVLTKDISYVNDKVPDIEGGKAQDIMLEQTGAMIDIMNAVRRVLANFEKMTGAEKRKNRHIPLNMYGVAKKAAIDARLVNKDAPDEPGSKTNRTVEETVKILKESEDYKGTVAIFCDLKRRKENGVVTYYIYEDLKRKLIEQGVPSDQIFIMESGMSTAKKEKVFADVNAGYIRVIIGHSQTLGTGVNIQERLKAVIHMDAPDRPMDYTQRNGRILRQGNMHKAWGKDVKIIRFGVIDSLDVTAYQRLKTKSGFIDNIMDGTTILSNIMENRVIEEEEEGLFDNILAQISGSQYALLKLYAEKALRKLLGRKKQYEADQIYVTNLLKKNKALISKFEDRVKAIDGVITELSKLFTYDKDGNAIIKSYKLDGVKVAPNDIEATIKETINKTINEEVEAARSNAYYKDKDFNYTLEINGLPFVITVKVIRESAYDNKRGAFRIIMHKVVSYTCKTFGIEEPYVNGGQALNAVYEIMDNVINSKSIKQEKEILLTSINRMQEEIQAVSAREGKPFELNDAIKEAEIKVEELEVLMQKEMAEKEAKYSGKGSGTEIDISNESGDDDGDDDNDSSDIVEEEPATYERRPLFARVSPLGFYSTIEKALGNNSILDLDGCRELIQKIDEAFGFTTILVNNDQDLIKLLPGIKEEVENSNIGGVYFNGNVYLNLEGHDSIEELLLTYIHEHVHKAADQLFNPKRIIEIARTTPNADEIVDPDFYKNLDEWEKGQEILAHTVVDLIKKNGYDNFINNKIDLSLLPDVLANRIENIIKYYENSRLQSENRRRAYESKNANQTDGNIQRDTETGTISDGQGSLQGSQKEVYRNVSTGSKTVLWRKGSLNRTNQHTTNDGTQLLFSHEELRIEKETGAKAIQDKSRKSNLRKPGITEVQRENNPTTWTELDKLKPGEMASVERIFTEQKSFSFLAPEKITSVDDVAYIFKNLEDSAIENSFIVLVKNGEPIILHVGMGAQTETVMDLTPLIKAETKINADQIYVVHNHPSGNLICSSNDQRLLSRVVNAFGDKVQDGIIINTKSGYYGVFTPDDGKDKREVPNQEDYSISGYMPVYKFDKLAFSKDYKPQAYPIRNAQDVSRFISSHRLGDRKKIAMLIVDNSHNINANMLTDFTDLSNTQKLNDAICYNMVTFAGRACILYGDFTYTRSEAKRLSSLVAKSSMEQGSVLDIITSSGNFTYSDTKSAANEGIISEDKQEYNTEHKNESQPEESQTEQQTEPQVEEPKESKIEKRLRKMIANRDEKIKALRTEVSDIRYDFRLNRDIKERARIITDFAKRNVNDKVFDAMQKVEYNSIMTEINNAVKANDFDLPFTRLVNIINSIELKGLQEQLDNILNIKVVRKDKKNVSVANKVDDEARSILEKVRYELSHLKMPVSDERLQEMRARRKQLIDDYKAFPGMQGINEQIKDIQKQINARKDELKHSKVTRYGSIKKTIADRIEQLENEPELNEDETLELKALYLTNIVAEVMHLEGELMQNELDREEAAKKYRGKEREKQLLIIEKYRTSLLASSFDAHIKAIEEVYNIIDEGMNNLNIWVQQKYDRKRRVGRMFIEAVKKNPIPLPGMEDNVNIIDKVSAFFKIPLWSFDFAIKHIDKNHPAGKGELFNYFMRSNNGIMAANDNYLNNLHNDLNRLDEICKRIFGKSLTKVAKESSKIHDKVIYVETDEYSYPLSLSKGQALYIYMVWKMDDGKAHLMRQGFTEESIDELAEFIGDKYIAFSDYIQDEFLPSLRKERFNPTHVEMFGTSMTSRENYFPLVIDRKSIHEEVKLGQSDYGLPKTITGSIINRTGNLLPIDIKQNAFRVLEKHLQDMEEWNAYALVNDDINKALSNLYVKNLMEANEKGSHSFLKDAAKVAVRQFNPSTDSRRYIDKMFGRLQRNLAVGNIAFKITPALKQLLSIPAFLDYSMSPVFIGIFLKNLSLVDTKYGTIFNWAIDKLPSYRERVTNGYFGNEVLRYEKGSSKFGIAIDKLANTGMLLNRGIDALSSAVGAKTVYEYALIKYKHLPNKYELARFDAEAIFNETQQSNEPHFLSIMQADGGIFNRAITTYMNNNIGYYRKLIEGVDELTRNTQKEIYALAKQYKAEGRTDYEREVAIDILKAKGQAVKRIAMFGFGMQAIWYYFSTGVMGFGGDDDDKKKALMKALATGPTSGIPLIGNATESVFDKVYSNESGNRMEYSPILFVKEWGDNFNRIMKASRQFGLSPELAKSIMAMAMKFGGINAETFENMAIGALMLVEQGQTLTDDKLAALFILNVPQSQRKIVADKLFKDKPLEEYSELMAIANKAFKADKSKFMMFDRPRTKELFNSFIDEWYDLNNKTYDEVQKDINNHKQRVSEFEKDTAGLAEYISKHKGLADMVNDKKYKNAYNAIDRLKGKIRNGNSLSADFAEEIKTNQQTIIDLYNYYGNK